jgi:hypothetical protein
MTGAGPSAVKLLKKNSDEDIYIHEEVEGDEIKEG